MPIASTTQTGAALPVVAFASSKVVAAGAASQTVQAPAGARSFMVTVPASGADVWLRVGYGNIAADGADGCDIVPPGCKWTERFPDNPLDGSALPRIALATLDGSTVSVVVRFMAE